MRNTAVGVRVAAMLAAASLLAGCAWIRQADVPRAGSPAGSLPNAITDLFTLSANGRYLFFDSQATNLVAGTSGNPSDDSGGIYRRDQLNGQTVLLRPGAHLLGNDSVSRDLQRMLIQEDEWVAWDRSAGTTEPFVIGPDGAPLPRSQTMGATLSGNGRFVAFRQWRPASHDVTTYVRDLDANTTKLVATVPEGPNNTYIGTFDDALSLTDDGAGLSQGTCTASAFSRSSAVCSQWLLQLVNVTTATVAAPLPNQIRPFQARLDAAGRFLAYNDSNDVWVLNTQTFARTLISVGWNGLPQTAYAHAISANGRYIAFESEGKKVVPEYSPTLRLTQVYVRDRVLGITTLISADQGGKPSADFSMGPAISADGRYVSFRNFGLDLTPESTGYGWRVYTKSALIPRITGVSPGSSGRGHTVSMTITGSGFRPDSDVVIGREGHALFHTAPVITDTTIRFDVAVELGTPLGDYSVTVVNPGTGPGRDAGVAANCAGCFTVTAT